MGEGRKRGIKQTNCLTLPIEKEETVSIFCLKGKSDVFCFYDTTMAKGGAAALTEPESVPGAGGGAVELRDSAHEELWDHPSEQLVGEYLAVSTWAAASALAGSGV